MFYACTCISRNFAFKLKFCLWASIRRAASRVESPRPRVLSILSGRSPRDCRDIQFHLSSVFAQYREPVERKNFFTQCYFMFSADQETSTCASFHFK
jgi:hypothetical protein